MYAWPVPDASPPTYSLSDYDVTIANTNRMNSDASSAASDIPNENLRALLDGVVAALIIAKDATAAFPPLQSAVGGVAGIVDIVKKMRSNIGQIKLLEQYLHRLSTTFQNPIFKNEKGCPEDLQRRIDTLERQLKETTEKVRKIASKRRVIRFLSSDSHAGDIEECIRQISWAINNFVIGGTITIELGVSRLLNAVEKGFDKVDTRLDVMTGKIEGLSGQISAGDSSPTPRYAVAARFNYPSQRAVCGDGTRVETLAAIYEWSHPHQTQQGVPAVILQTPRAGAQAFWLCGWAGTGKSTIAQSVAEWCWKRNYLGASFFCSRDNRECSDIQMIFPTIAYQLGQFFPEFRKKTAEVLKQDPDIQTSLVSHQLKKLIVDPLQALLPNFPPCAVVIDALDECKDDETTSLIIRALSQHLPELAPLKIFLTSRPIPNITHGFHSTGLLDVTQRIVLHEVPSNITDRDIEIFLQERLAAIRETYKLDRSWPSAEQVSKLTKLSNGLFIYAATAVRFIGDSSVGDPQERLQLLLNSQGAPVGEATPFNQLDELYLQVLRSAYPKMTRELKARLKIVLGTLVLIRDRLSPSAIDRLMDLKPGSIRTTLARLHSVVTVPEQDDGVINIIHKSFQDFLIDENRCRDRDLLVSPAIQHRLIAQRCLETMIGGLRMDICNIGQSVPSSEVAGLPDLIAQHIPPSLQYASLHWAQHVCSGEVDDELYGLLIKFSESHLLSWLEVLSLLGELGSAISVLQSLRNRLLVCNTFTLENEPHH
ncbi:uncharacterized protein PHACADRAFT_205257 [Phanerochaete carnosa HHB-10118-sp]|uniref:Nephrocystin 3-like N-terminal domain-containing protein n=1 Tax=Phanerochaete carnosa (strain HHB-10118-sp) TaxID=650164 RepID=K5WI81_PHACS|nr:uncharacterized protein PHACADRAFT_205257 [Phanerochaete carnosa HHB-10118-sp]EKM59080.1 hypothetical protein PHACADRAFT_205257 [Phanerochaete carnosa HHB-10118-sp]